MPKQKQKQSTSQQRQLIQIRRRAAGMTDEKHKDFMVMQFRKDSTTLLSYNQAEQYLAHLADQGFGSKKPQHKGGYKATLNQDQFIRLLWKQLAEAGVLDKPEEQGLRGFVERTTGAKQLEWCDTKQKTKVITALKRWKESLKK